jgi:hypothetical protein
MPDRVLQNDYCVALLQHRLSYNLTMNFPAMTGEIAAAIAPVLAAATPRVRNGNINIHLNILPILLVIALVIAGVVWFRRRPRTHKNLPERPDDWPPRHPERRPNDGKDDPSPWQ